MKKIYFLPLLALLLGLSSCQTDLDIPFPAHEPKLVLNGFLVEDGTFFLYVTRSFGALEQVEDFRDTSLIVDDAEVSLWQDDEKLSDFQFLRSETDTILYEPIEGVLDTFINTYGVWVYLPASELAPPKAGETYEFRVSHPEYGEARVSNTVMPKPEVLEVELVIDSITSNDFDGYQDNWTALNITVQDPGEYFNYYNFGGIISYTEEFPDGLGGFVRDTVNSTLYATTEIVRDAGTVYGNNSPISDADFNGQTHTITIFTQLPGCCGYPSDIGRPDGRDVFRLELETFLMDDFFGLYQEKRRLQSETRTEGIEGAIIPREPVSVNGNVEGGYGLLGSFNSSVFRIDL